MENTLKWHFRYLDHFQGSDPIPNYSLFMTIQIRIGLPTWDWK